MGLFSKNRQAFGLDIGSSSVKLAELELDRKDGVWRLKTSNGWAAA